jgi:hypothetical protein
MATVTRMLRSATCLMALCALLPSANAASSAAAAPNLDMVRELQAAGPHPSLGDAGAAWGRLVGSWSVAYGFTSKDGKVTHKSGSYSAGWVMDGRAVQDVWTVDPSGDRTEREIYTTLRYADPKSGALCATFIDPEHASIAKFTGGAVGDDRIVTLTHDLGVGRDNRWSFNDISATSMVFRDEQSNDGGKTWRVVEEDQFTRHSTNPTGPNLDMTAVLQAAGPHPSLGDAVKVFDRLAGTWDGEYNTFSKDGKTTRSLGEWTFGWVLDGRAMQDLFIINPSVTLKERYVGVSLRYFDPKSQTWSVTFIDPENNVVETLTGGAVGDDRIVLSSQGADGKQRRWSLVDIQRDSWVFRDETSLDGGKTWRLIEEDHMTRHGTNLATM